MISDGKNKKSSLRWAIEELSKQKKELEDKLTIAYKREETGSLISEVNAQKYALNKRIAALEEGLQVSTKLVDTPIDFLEEEISKINDKLDIAQERLQNLEQDQYLEDLGRKLNRKQKEEIPEDLSIEEESYLADQTLPSSNPSANLQPFSTLEQEPATTTETMAITSNRIETENSSASRLPEKPKPEDQESSRNEKSKPVPVKGLEATAEKLGVEPEFLVQKGTQALLRMIARNGGKLSFPLEIDQID